MFKKILCALLAGSIMLVSLGGCGKKIETLRFERKTSVVNFAAYKQDIISILDEANVKYDYAETIIGNEENVEETKPYIFTMKINFLTDLKEELIVGFKNSGQIESFTVSFGLKRTSVEECDLNIRDYPYIREIFNLISEIKVSSFGCNRFLKSSREGIKEKYEANTDAFYKNEYKYFSRDKTKTWYLQYTIYMKTAADPVIFEETLTFKGNLSPRT